MRGTQREWDEPIKATNEGQEIAQVVVRRPCHRGIVPVFDDGIHNHRKVVEKANEAEVQDLHDRRKELVGWLEEGSLEDDGGKQVKHAYARRGSGQ